jgi:hypothetical protein
MSTLKETDTITIRKGDEYIARTTTIRGEYVWPTGLWEVKHITRKTIKFYDRETGDTIVLQR